MSAPAAVTASPTTPSASSTGVQGANGVPGLFLNLLHSNALSFQQNGDAAAQGTQFGKSGFSFEPTLLILPQGLADLSETNLQKLMEKVTGLNSTGELTDTVLVSLTPGTPAAGAIMHFLSHAEKATVTPLVGADGQPIAADAAGTSPLLVATSLSPSDLEKLKALISEEEPTLELPAVEMEQPLDTTNPTTESLALVMLVPVPTAQQTPEVKTADDFSLLQSKLSTDKRLSPFIGGEDGDLLGDAGLRDTGTVDGDFKGSLSANSTISGPTKDINGKMDSPANDKISAFFMNGDSASNWNHDDVSALLSTLPASSAAGGTTSSPGTMLNPILGNPSASAAHPATQAVAAVLEKMSSSGSEKEKQTLTLQLDPPELGRVQVHLDYEKGSAMKVHLVAESKDTFNALQRDSHALTSALEQAGIQTDGSSLSFDLAGGNQSFNQMLGQSQDNNGKGERVFFALDGDNLAAVNESGLLQISSSMNFIPDAATGTVRYSLLV